MRHAWEFMVPRVGFPYDLAYGWRVRCEVSSSLAWGRGNSEAHVSFPSSMCDQAAASLFGTMSSTLAGFFPFPVLCLPLPCWLSSGSTALIIICTYIFVSGSVAGKPDLWHLSSRECSWIYLLKLMLRLAVMTIPPDTIAFIPTVASIMVAMAPPWKNLVIIRGKEKCFKKVWKERVP